MSSVFPLRAKNMDCQSQMLKVPIVNYFKAYKICVGMRRLDIITHNLNKGQTH